MSGVQFDLDLDAGGAIRDAAELGNELDDLVRMFRDLDRASGKNMGGVTKDMKGASTGMTGAVAKGALLAGVLTSIVGFAKDAAFALVRFGVQAASALTRAVLGATAFREKAELAFKTLMHGKNGAKAFEEVKRLALEMGTPLNETVHAFQEMAAAQFNMKDSIAIFKRLRDVQLATGASSDALGRAQLALTQIQAKGRLQAEELLQLQESVNLSQGLVLEALVKNTGKSLKEVQKLMQTGKVDAKTGIKAILDAMAMKTGGKEAGAVAKEFLNTTVSGALERIKNFGGILLDDVAKELGPTFKELKPILDDIMAALQSEDAKAVIHGIAAAFKLLFQGAVAAWPVVKEFLSGFWSEGKKIWAVMKEIGGSISQAFGGDSKLSMEDIMSAARILGRVLAWVVVIIGIFIAVLGGVVAVVAGVVGAILAIPLAILGLLGAIGVLAGEFAGKAIALGAAIVNGIKNGISNGAGAVIQKIKDLASNAIGSAKAVLGVASPSREFEWIGQMVGAGFAGGVDTSTPSTTSAMQSMVSPDNVTLTGQGGGGGPLFSATFNFAPGTSKEDAHAIGDEVERRVESILERYGLEAGL